MKLSKVNTVILSLTLLLSIISTVYLYSATPASANAIQPEAAKPALGPGTFRCPTPTSSGTGDCGDAGTWYQTYEGVLAADSGQEAPLYPFFHGDVEFSVSRFGENINPFATSAQVWPQPGGSPIQGVGFQYMDSNGQAYDPIRNAQVDINHVVDGWKLVVTYNSAATRTFRTIWAYALFSDYIEAGSPSDGHTSTNACPDVMGGWILCPYNTPMPLSPTLTPNGGRKTNGFVVTAPTPLVLVDTPRRVVVASVNTIYDPVGGVGDTSTPVARLTLTFDFNKDTKTLIIIKDVKLLLDIKVANTLTESQCENPAVDNTIAGSNYVPFYASAKSQGNGLACFELLDTEELDQAATTATSVAGYAHFFDALNLGSVPYLETAKCLTTSNGKGTNVPLYHWDTSRPNCAYDVMQAVDQPGGLQNHITSKAFWPVPDWFTVDAKAQGQFFTKLEGTRTTDLFVPPDVVGTSVQWNFILNLQAPNPANPTLDARLQWRSVETLTVTDRNDGQVCQAPAPLGIGGAGQTSTTISTISQHLPTSESVTPLETETVIDGDTYLTQATTTSVSCNNPAHNIIDKEQNYFEQMIFNPWDLNQALTKHFETFVNYFTAGTTGVQSFSTYIPYDVPSAGLKAGAALSFLNVPEDHINEGSQWAPITTPGWDSYGSFAERVLVVTKSGSTGKGFDTGKPDVLTLLHRSNPVVPGDYVLVGPPGPGGCDEGTTATDLDNTANSCTGFTTINSWPAGTVFKVIFSINTALSNPGIPASYEWVTVGRDSFAADAIGAAMVTEAFVLGSSHVVTGLGGLDMADNSGNNPSLPFVLQRFNTPAVGSPDPSSDYTECFPPTGIGTNVGGFLGVEGLFCPEGPRFHLRDDFSTVVPIDGSNIIVVGGPRANQAANLANDYLSVIFRGTETAAGVTPTTDLYAPGAWDSLSTTGGVFSPLEQECTPTPAGPSNPDSNPLGACTFPIVGSSVLSTYMDVDGTVFLVVYGGNAQDTFWTAQYALQYVTSLGIKGGPAFADGELNAESTGMAGNVYCGPLVPTTADYISHGQVCVDNSVTSGAGPAPGAVSGLYAGTTSVIFSISYLNPHPPSITVFKELDTISEIFPEQDQ